MISESVIYKGRRFPKENFRAFVYGYNNKIKLVDSWDEFQRALDTGIWFVDKPTNKAPKKRR